MNVFTLKRAVDGMANGPPVKCKPTKSGSIFIEVAKKTPKQKSVEDNYANWLYCSQSLITSDFKLKKICHQMSRTGQHGRIRNKRTQTTRNYCCQENLGALQPICEDNQRARHSGKNQYWIPAKRNKTLHSKPSKMLPMPKIRTHQKFMQRKGSLCWMWWGRAQCRWVSKWPRMCKLWRRPPCYFERLPNTETRERHCDPKE